MYKQIYRPSVEELTQGLKEKKGRVMQSSVPAYRDISPIGSITPLDLEVNQVWEDCCFTATHADLGGYTDHDDF